MTKEAVLKNSRLKARSLVIVFLLTSFSFLAISGAVNLAGGLPHVYGSRGPTYCSTIGGSWDGVSTCTFSGSYTLSSGTWVTAGTSLVITSAHNIITIDSGGTLQVDSGGHITSSISGDGIYNEAGAIINDYGFSPGSSSRNWLHWYICGRPPSFTKGRLITISELGP